MKVMIDQRTALSAALCCLMLTAAIAHGQEPRVLDGRLHHLRIDGPREWSEFPEKAESDRLEVVFEGKANTAAQTLELRQQDVKQSWSVSLNDRTLGQLVRDENDMVVYFDVPPGAVRDGQNSLLIEQGGRRASAPDDIRVGEIVLHPDPQADVLGETTLEVHVTDADSGEAIPCRLTILNDRGALQSVGAESNGRLAVRPGVVFTADGAAKFGLPAGTYTIYAGRGFEYSLAAKKVTLPWRTLPASKPSEEKSADAGSVGYEKEIKLAIRREVPTEGYVACDTHVHTLTHSGHGDASVEERMITLAAEGVELPIATDHNVQIDHDPFARKMNVRQYFTPVVGNEVTTRTGHFNIFPAPAGGAPPEHRSEKWQETLASIRERTDARVVILNHARDLHGTRPFGPALYNEAVGEMLDGQTWIADGMEVINSGATQTDATELLRDWMTQLNRGRDVTPVGCSDSHDVARHFVAQGRTYIRCDDADPGEIDVEQAVDNFLAGRVMVSYGLLAELTIDGKFRHGDLAPSTDDKLQAHVRVLGPHWTTADRIELLANGRPVKVWNLQQAELDERRQTGVIWEGDVSLPTPRHDVFLTVIASGPGIDGLYWPTAKAYQPTSPEWTPRVLACSGAIWIDGDGDGRKSSAHHYAQRLVEKYKDDLPALLAALGDYDQAVAAQAARLVDVAGVSLLAGETQAALAKAAPSVQDGFRAYLDAWRENQKAQAEGS
ncbi:MAG: CehA/McbA family metallohydrolase [Pirellulaceae bacterium]